MEAKKQDQRVRITKLLIRNTLLGLLQSKPIQMISVKEVCEKSGINRGTFYTHYKDIYDLLEQLENEMIEDFKTQLAPILTSSEKQLTSLEFFTDIFQFLANHSDMCTIMLSDRGDKNFIARMLEIGKMQCVSAYSKYFKNATTEQIDYFYCFVSAGCVSILTQWIMSGMREPVNEIAEVTEKLVSQTIRFLE